MRSTPPKGICILAVALAGHLAAGRTAAETADFRVGAAGKDITPPPGIPMWGYGA